MLTLAVSIGYSNGWNDTTLAMHEQYGNTESPPMHSVDSNNLNGVNTSLYNSITTTSENGLLVSPQNLENSTNSSVYFSDQPSTSDTDVDVDAPKRMRNPVPDNKKDDKYWQRRQKNNMAAKRSREMKKRKIDEELVQAQEAISENAQLKQEIEVLKAEISSLRRLLKDANMTLSLWIKARQASEAPSNLPPMIRNHTNMPYVSFPVSASNIP